MYMTLTQIGKTYDISAIKAGKLLYELGIRDPEHPEEKGFPYQQYVTHGIAEAVVDRNGEVRYYRYNIEPIKEEFERLLLQPKKEPASPSKNVPFAQFVYHNLSEATALLKKTAGEHESIKSLKNVITLLDTVQRRAQDEDPDLAMPLDTQSKHIRESLKIWRRKVAQLHDLPAYAVLSNAVLHAVAYYRPETRDELTAIKGFGEKKLEAYGEDVIAIVHNQSTQES
jgi:superfamily II DNA helicase RecQ